MDVWNDLQDELERHRSSASIINQYLYAYGQECCVLIEKISACASFDEAVEYFDALYEIQRRLSTVKYKFGFLLSDRFQDFIYCLDRDDVYSRKHWYGEFRAGLKWPSE